MRFFKCLIHLCLFLILFLLVGCTSTNTKYNMPSSKPKDFNFVFNYGVNAKNQLDTVNGKYTKDMVLDPSVTIDLKLSDDEMNAIYSKMKEISILSYPDFFNPKSNSIKTPFYTYKIRIIIDGKEKNIAWMDENASESKEAVKLRELFIKIIELVDTKEEIKKLPPSNGGYD